jgi:hypothetical protein
MIPPNYRDVNCCSFCKHDGSYFNRCQGEHVYRCDKHNYNNSPTAICDDYEEGKDGE